jgi:competence protein ComEC
VDCGRTAPQAAGMRLLPFAGSAAAAVALVLILPQLPGWPLVVLAVALACVASGAWLRYGLAGALRHALWGGALGLAWAQWHGEDALAHRWPVARETELVEFTGCVVGVPQVTAGRVRFEVRVDAATEPSVAPARRMRLAWYRTAARPQPGEAWQVSSKLRAPRGLVNPGLRDYTLALLHAGVDATGTVRKGRRVDRAGACGGDAGFDWQQRVDALRARLADRLQAANAAQAAPESARARGEGLLLALALGLQDAVPEPQWRLFALTGVTHLVAISGLHVTLFAWLVLAGTALVRSRGRQASLRAVGPGAALLAVTAAFGYALLAGGNLPALRTVWMLAAALAVRVARREVGVAQAWAAALLAALLVDPWAPAGLGFWLSFGAVGALLWSSAGLVRSPPRGPRATLAAALRGFLAAQFAVTLVLAPLLLVTVGCPSWVSLPANALAIPLFTLVVVPAVLLATACAALSPVLAEGLVRAVAAGLGWLVDGLDLLAGWPGATAALAAPDTWRVVLAVAGALAACAPALQRRWRATASLGCVCLLAWPPSTLAPGEVRVTVLEVGQGNATLVETRHHVLVFDPGPAYGPEADAGGRVVVPALRAAGWQRLDALVVSHADADHAGGVDTVLATYADAPVWWGGDDGAAAHGRQPCRAGLSWHWDGVEFRFLHPGEAPERDDNAGSCVLRVAGPTHAALLLADIPERVEDRVVASAAATGLPAALVLVAHHGSATASGSALRAATRPAAGPWHAVVPAGYRNRWGFPKPAVRRGWREAGAQLHVTGQDGAVTVLLPVAGTPVLSLARDAAPRWWRPPD